MEIISSEKVPAAVGPYSSAVKAGKTLYISGQLPIDVKTGSMPETVAEQTAQSLSNMKALLESAGGSLSDVVKTTVLLADIKDFGEMNDVYGKTFLAPYPARSAFEVGALPKGAKVEIECVAVLNS